MTNEELISKIKAEIERLKSNMDDRDPLAPNQKAGYLFALADVLSFLDTLESEKPVPNDLEEAADNHIRKVVDAAGHPGWEWETQDIKDAFIAGAKWQKEQDDKELSDLLTIAHLQGAEQMKEQMMKEKEFYGQ